MIPSAFGFGHWSSLEVWALTLYPVLSESSVALWQCSSSQRHQQNVSDLRYPVPVSFDRYSTFCQGMVMSPDTFLPLSLEIQNPMVSQNSLRLVCLSAMFYVFRNSFFHSHLCPNMHPCNLSAFAQGKILILRNLLYYHFKTEIAAHLWQECLFLFYLSTDVVYLNQSVEITILTDSTGGKSGRKRLY